MPASPTTEAHYRLIPKVLLWPLVLSLLFLFVFFVLPHESYGPLYHILMLCCFGMPLMHYQTKIAARLQRIPLAPAIRFIALGFAAVILEECLVALLFSLFEGFSFTLWWERACQFVSFNLLAFTGFIIGWYGLSRRLRFQPLDLFLIAGGWGLFSEHILSLLITFPLAASALILPTMSVYALILAPAFLSLRPTERGLHLRPLWQRAGISWLTILIISLAPIALLMHLRQSNPTAFPSCAYIPCDEPHTANRPAAK